MRRVSMVAALLPGILILGNAPAQTGAGSGKATLLTKINIVDYAKPEAQWSPANEGQDLAVNDRLRTGEESRASARLSDLSILNLDELTTIAILPPKVPGTKATLDHKEGSSYFFSREKSREVSFQTPSANGAIRGTAFLMSVSLKKRTVVTMLVGQFELFNEFGAVLVGVGEQAQADLGRKPTKCSIKAANVSDKIPWSLLIESNLPPGKTMATAEKSELLAAIRAAAKQWPPLASQIVRVAVRTRPPLAQQIFQMVSGPGGEKGRTISPEQPP